MTRPDDQSGHRPPPSDDTPLARQNHSVPEAYLRGWSDDGASVWAYRLLASHDDVPLWSPQRLRSLTTHRDLYTSIRTGEESDEVECWLNREFESPAAEPIVKVRSDQLLTPSDWKALQRYAVALDQRTAGAFFGEHRRWQEDLPRIIRAGLRRAKRNIAKRRSADERPDKIMPTFGEFPAQIEVKPLPGGDGEIRATVTNGRELWLFSLHHFLTQTIQKIPQHSWSILHPYRDSEWFTSDRPLLRLRYTSPSDFDFAGGWNQRDCELLLPLSPRHLLYTQVGKHSLGTCDLNRTETLRMHDLLARRADRWIIAREPMTRVAMLRARLVSEERYRAEQELWATWHDAHRAAEERKRGPDIDLGLV